MYLNLILETCDSSLLKESTCPRLRYFLYFFPVCWNSYTTKHFFVIHTTLSGSSSFRAFLLESVLAKNEKAADKLFDFVRATFDLTLSFILKIEKKKLLYHKEVLWKNIWNRLLLLTFWKLTHFGFTKQGSKFRIALFFNISVIRQLRQIT